MSKDSLNKGSGGENAKPVFEGTRKLGLDTYGKKPGPMTHYLPAKPTQPAPPPPPPPNK